MFIEGLGQASWADWMAHIVPRKYRGKYFAQRSRILGLIQLAVAVCAAWLLDYLVGNIMLAFTIVWLACFAARICSGILLKCIYEPAEINPQASPEGNFLVFLRELFSTTFGRFVLATSLLSLGVGFAAPFFAVHMLNNLKFSYVQYAVINIAATGAMIAFLGLWGRLIDRVGSVLPLRLCALIIATVPLPWVIFENFWMLLASQAIAGFAWAGFNLAAFVFYLSSSEPQVRVSRISYFNALALFCVFVGSTLGGLLGPYLPVLTSHYLQTVFFVSFILRFGPALLFRRVQEKPYQGKLSPLERFFFDPTLVIRPGIARSIFRLPKRSV